MDLENESNLVYVGRGSQRQGLRPSKWGNPYRAWEDGTHEEVIAKHKAWLFSKKEFKVKDSEFTNKELLNQIHELKGKNLVCHCAPNTCHGDILLKLANSKFSCYYCINCQTDNEKEYSIIV